MLFVLVFVCLWDIGFSFDRVFPAESTQAEIFDFGVKGIVEGKLHCHCKRNLHTRLGVR